MRDVYGEEGKRERERGGGGVGGKWPLNGKIPPQDFTRGDMMDSYEYCMIGTQEGGSGGAAAVGLQLMASNWTT